MKLQIMSDLHMEHWTRGDGLQFEKDTQTTADVLVLAGDIVPLNRRNWNWSVARLQEFKYRYKHVVYVPGNHEWYGAYINYTTLDTLMSVTGVEILYPGRIATIEGKRFLGGTMFQPAQPYPGAYMPISDHGAIHDFERCAAHEYETLRAHLQKELAPGDIVVTHHAPSLKSLDAQWVGHPCNYWFITPQIEDVLLSSGPALWVHGHVHTPFDYKLMDTRVICNPRGYPGESVRFNPQLVVEI